MNYKVIDPSTVYPFDLTFLKDQCRITHTAHDNYLVSLIGAAIDWAISYTGRQINFATLQAFCPLQLPVTSNNYLSIPTEFTIDRGPFGIVCKIDYLDTSGNRIEITSRYYELVKNDLSAVIILSPDFVFVNPNLSRFDCFRVTYTAGYGGTEEGAIPFPEVVKNAIAMKAARMYTTPDDGVDEKTSVSENLLKSYRCPII